MARAYAYAESNGHGPVPLDLEIAWRCEDMGAVAVLGQNVAAGLIRRVTLAGNVYRAFASRAAYRDESGATNWAEWAGKYPAENRLLNRAAMAAGGDE